MNSFMLMIIAFSSSSSSQGCDLPEQSTVHVVFSLSGSSSSRLLSLAETGEEEQNSLTRLDLSSSHLPSTFSSLPVILERSDGGGGGVVDRGAEEEIEEAQAAGVKGQSR